MRACSRRARFCLVNTTILEDKHLFAEWKAEFVHDTCLADSDDDDGVADGPHHHHGGNDDVPCSQYPITIGGLMESYADLTPGGALHTHTHIHTRTHTHSHTLTHTHASHPPLPLFCLPC